ncbi:unnamed protein product [Orchesella dallaii]|uniref:SCP domain-containing protein n=1 Tax=Orchesella dallaii TaxID=48710 RepID=A0ABP1RZC2_9HEXA
MYYYQQAGLIHHDYLSARHGSPPLTLDPDLNEMGRKCAYYYATNNLYDHTCPYHIKYYPKKEKGIGECLWRTGNNKVITSYHDAEVRAVRRFYQEIEEHNFNDVEGNIPKFLKVGHFAQMLWSGVKNLGVGVYYSKSNPEFGVMIVYHYYPIFGFGDVEKMIFPEIKRFI